MADKRFIKGLFKDTGQIDQPEGTWRYALNAVVNRIKGSISNEKGTIKAGELEPGFVVIGAIEISDNRVVLFLRQTESVQPVMRDEIGIWEKDTYRALYQPVTTESDPKLNFNTQYLIEGTYKINSNNDLIVYFTDDLNPPRAFNVTRQERSLESGQPKTNLYGINPSDSHANHIDLLNLFPSSGPIPAISLPELYDDPAISEGGGLTTGVYYLAIAYVDEDLVATNFLSVSNPVSIIEEFDSTRPTTKIDGAKAGTQTSKSIKWRVSNTGAVDYKYIRPVVIRKQGTATDAYKLNDIEIGTVINNGVTFNGTENLSAAPLESVIVDTIGYDTAKNITQLDDVLYLGNTTSNKDIGYQKYANNIKVQAVTKRISQFDTFIASVDNFETGFGTKPVDSTGSSSIVQEIDDEKSYRSDKLNYRYRGYMRDEVYAFYIAFVLHDGSMSYAYHIPGRDTYAGETTKLSSVSSSNPYSNLANLSPHAKVFHVTDTSLPEMDPLERGMNYWENANELYPANENFEVWDETSFDTGEPINNLANRRVRHHHFPSNSNERFSSISQIQYEDNGHEPQHPSFFELSNSAGTDAIGVDYSGTLRIYRGASFNPDGPALPGSGWSAPCTFDLANHSVLDNTEAFATFCPNGDEIVIPATMTITSLSYRSWYFRNNGSGNQCEPIQIRIEVIKDNVTYYAHADENGDPFSGALGCCQDGPARSQSTVTQMFPDVDGEDLQGDPIPMNLNAGDRIRMVGRGFWGNNSNRGVIFSNMTNLNGSDGEYNQNWSEANSLFILLNIANNSITATEYDLKVNHEVNILGFNLNDVKIPKSLKSKVQGFRIYRAKRGHENKTILGQAPILPMGKKANVIGMCAEAQGAPEAQQILGTLQNAPEIFYNKDPWPLPSTDIGYESGNYKNFAFPDFHLLRTKNSLSPATHISIQYTVGNFVWNGPTVFQDKKMVTRLDNFDSDTEPIEIRENWGYDSQFNCYPALINSAIFIGGVYKRNLDIYNQSGTFSTGIYPKMLGQKAKTYLLGDSIFSGQSLGFGGKIFNEFGESTAIFGLKDGHLLKALTNTPDADGDGVIDAEDYGRAHDNMPALLVNSEYASSEDGITNRSNVYIANLDAFKTDVYKSIDAQTLVYTGYEVLGDDLDKFVFDDDPNSYGYLQNIVSSSSTNYSTRSVYADGIYGGDTFITRYGFVSSLTPSNPEDLANPKRAIHYHIVESPDNINFRHSEDDDTLYFPGAAAKQLIRYAGKDFSHVDRLKYNDNYSAENDIRPAFPLPIRDINQTDFSTRTHRSTKADAGSFIDNYRIFLASQFKDLPKNRGELWKLASFNNLLYFHMENSLFAAKGKQSMQMNDGSEAFVGSGDIFQQEPDEVIQTELGYGGTQSQWAALTTRYGYFFVDLRAKKVFLMSDKLTEISLLGMERWFQDNLRFKLEQYGLMPTDNPLYCTGLHSIWDPKQKKIMLTLRDAIPTKAFLDGVAIGQINQNYQGAIYYDETINQFVENLNGTEAPESAMYTQMITFGGTVNPALGIPLWNIDEIAEQESPNSQSMLDWAIGSSGPYVTQRFFTTNQYLNYTSADTIFHFTGNAEDAFVSPTTLAAAGVSTHYNYVPIWIEQQIAAGNIQFETNIDIAVLSANAVPNSFSGEVGDLVDEGIVVHIDEEQGRAYVVPTSVIAYGDHTSPSPSVEFGCDGVTLWMLNVDDNPFDYYNWGGGEANTQILLEENCQVGISNSGSPFAGHYPDNSSLAMQPSPNAASFTTKTAPQVANEYSITVNGITYNDWYLPNRTEANAANDVLKAYHEPLGTTPYPQPSYGHRGAQTMGGKNLGRFWTSAGTSTGSQVTNMGMSYGYSEVMDTIANEFYNAVPNTASNVGEASWYIEPSGSGDNLIHAWLPRRIALSVLPMRYRPYDPQPEELTLETKLVLCDDPVYFTKDGWTVSYYPETNSWGSFHSYLPYLYFNTSTDFYSLTDRLTSVENSAANSVLIGEEYFSIGSEYVDKFIWKHNYGDYGSFYNGGEIEFSTGQGNFQFDFTNTYPFEIEFIDNELKTEDLIYSSINYTADTKTNDQKNIVNSGFDSAFVYNSLQMSDIILFKYLVNIRKTGNNWRFNKFRDMSKLITDESEYYTPNEKNVVGKISDGTIVPNYNNMFNIDGMHEIHNEKYLNLEKLWNLQKKFVDKWLGIRLICSNSGNYSVNLYTSSAEKRKYHR